MSLKGDHSHFEGAVGEVDFSFQQPVDEAMQQKLGPFLEVWFPDSKVEILGKLCQKKPEMGALGHYRIQVDGKDLVACVGRVGDAQCVETLLVGHQVFNHYRDQDIPVVNSVSFSQAGAKNPNNDWIINAQEHLGSVQLGDKTLDYHVHLEECAPDIVLLKDNGVDGRHAALGTLVGTVYNAGNSMPVDLISTLERTTDSTTLCYVEEGARVTRAHLQSQTKLEGASREFGTAGVAPNAFDSAIPAEMQQRMLGWIAEFEQNPCAPTAFNMIDKMIWEKPDGTLVLACCDTPSRGYLPMMTQNASYDLGTIIHSIILNSERYETTSESQIRRKIQRGLEEFVQAYNAETGLNLTVDEALNAAQRAFAFSYLQVPGLYSLGEIEITTSLDDHIDTTLTGIMRSVNKIEQYRPPSGEQVTLKHDG